jgi:hypothetical protein
MTSLRTHLLTAAAAGVVLAPAAAAQAAPTTLAVEQAPTRVAAWNGTLMWSRFDPATKAYTLVKSVNGSAPVPVGVAPRSGSPFDIDLGTGRSTGIYAVYTRAGDIYRLNVATGAETKLSTLSSPVLAERDPTIQRGKIAFIRRSKGLDELRIGETAAGEPKGSKLVVRRRSIESAELGNSQIAYVEERGSDFSTLFVHIRNLTSGADRQVYRAASGGANFADVTRPTYVEQPAAFVWARTNLGSGTGNRIVRYTLRGSKLAYAAGTPRYNSTAWAGATLGLLTSGSLDGSQSPGACVDGPTNYCNVQLSGPLQFDRNP